MIIVNRKEFLTLPPNTLFSEYEPCVFGPIMIKMETNQNDYYEQSIADAIQNNSSGDFVERLHAAEEAGANLEMDFHCIGRNGCFSNDKKLYAVYGSADVLKLLGRLFVCS